MTKARDIASMVTSTQTLANKTLAATTTFPAGIGGYIGIQVFTAYGTYTKTTGTNSILVYVTGAGGGGGSSGGGVQWDSGGGGAGGGTAIKRITGGVTSITVSI